jgi:hypothetical protein
MPWFHKASRGQLVAVGVAAATVASFAMDPGIAVLYFEVLFSQHGQQRLGPAVVVGHFIANVTVGAGAGLFAHWYFKRSRLP